MGGPGLDELRARLSERLGRPVTAVAPLGGGACQDLFAVDVPGERGPERLVLRSDAPRPLPGSIPRAAERVVVAAAAAAGVKTPAPKGELLRGLVREGADAWLMERVEGEAIGRRVVSHPSLAPARARAAVEWAGELAKLHAVTPRPDLVAALGAPPADPLAAQVAACRALADAQDAPRPAIELALAWLARQSAPREVVLIHGDFRVGNLLCRPDGLAAVLDWEFAHWGSPLEDLAWLCVRDWRFGALGLACGGVATRAALVEAYRAASGREVDLAALRAWEVLGNVRWALGSLEQGRRFTSGERPDLELLAIARRAPEMEWEALRLIDEVEPSGFALPPAGPRAVDPTLAAVARFLDEQLRPAVPDKGLAFRARVAAALLEGLAAEAAAGAALEAGARARLTPLVAEGTEAALAAAIRAGRVDQVAARRAVREGLAARLRVTTPDFDLGERFE